MDKNTLRIKYLQIRDSLPPKAREECSQKICSVVAETQEFKNCEVLLCYSPIRTEVDVMQLFDMAVSEGKTVGFPRVDGDDMEFYAVSSCEELTPGTFGVSEPQASEKKRIDPRGKRTLMIVPGLAFDEMGNRIGYGKGYYDRYLRKYDGGIDTIAVCFEKQVTESIPSDESDIPVGKLATINGVADCGLHRKYESIIDRIENSRRFDAVPGIEISGKVLERLGNPDKKLEFIHVAGTNGKGSVCAMMASALSEAGLKVGLFTSPHLIRFNERIRIFENENIINDMKHTCIPDEDVVRLAERVLAVCDDISLTMFDYCMAIAMLYFSEKQTDIVILECGLGGRLDSTNAIDAPAVSVITSIGLDHMQYLGNSLTDIAKEKAGILKTGTDAVVAACDSEVKAVFERVCAERNIDVEFLTSGDVYPGSLGLKGEYQRRNAVLASRALKRLYEKKRELFPAETDINSAISTGFLKAAWDGRFQIFREEPLLIIDGAHNEHGVRALKESLMKAYPGRKLNLVMGVMKDKDFTGMLKDMQPLCNRFYASQTDYSRALPASELKEQALRCGYKDTDSITIDKISSLAGDTVVFGSLYFVGDVLKQIKNNFDHLKYL